MASKILDVYWISGIQTIGIVVTENEVGEVKFRIAKVRGCNLDEDKYYIRDHGMKFHIDGLIEFIKRHEK